MATVPRPGRPKPRIASAGRRLTIAEDSKVPMARFREVLVAAAVFLAVALGVFALLGLALESRRPVLEPEMGPFRLGTLVEEQWLRRLDIPRESPIQLAVQQPAPAGDCLRLLVGLDADDRVYQMSLFRAECLSEPRPDEFPELPLVRLGQEGLAGLDLRELECFGGRLAFGAPEADLRRLGDPDQVERSEGLTVYRYFRPWPRPGAGPERGFLMIVGVEDGVVANVVALVADGLP